MTRLFQADGSSVPVTVIQVDEARVLDRRTAERDGHAAVRLACGRPSRKAGRAHRGQLAKAGISDVGERIVEVAAVGEESDALEPGAEVALDKVFSEGDRVDIVGISRGMGFAGTIKRFNFSQQDNSHGNSLSHRIAGSTGQNQLPGRIFPGKKMPGHMGAKRVCQQNLPIVRIVPEDRVILVRGSIPGHVDGRVTIRKSARTAR